MRMSRSLIVIPVSATFVSVPTPTEPLWTRLIACSSLRFLLPNTSPLSFASGPVVPTLSDQPSFTGVLIVTRSVPAASTSPSVAGNARCDRFTARTNFFAILSFTEPPPVAVHVPFPDPSDTPALPDLTCSFFAVFLVIASVAVAVESRVHVSPSLLPLSSAERLSFALRLTFSDPLNDVGVGPGPGDGPGDGDGTTPPGQPLSAPWPLTSGHLSASP